MFVKNLITNTFPSIIHAPDESDIWKNLVENFNKSHEIKSINYENLLIITWNNTEDSILERCLNRRKINYKILGKNIEIWNNLQKFFLTLEEINKTSCEYIIGLDSHDVLFLGDPLKIISKFKLKNCEILFNCEKNFYPNFNEKYFIKNKNFQENISKNIFKYLNSGCWIGKKNFCQLFFKECSKVKLWEIMDCTDKLNLYNCDQSVVHDIFRKYYPKTQLDYNCDIFFNISFLNKKDIKIMEMQ
jgi:hypothetical protein